MKTIMKTICFLIVFCYTQCYSQDCIYRIHQSGAWPDKNIEGTFNDADFIFEGRIIDANLYWADSIKKKGAVCISQVVQITKIFKGSAQLKLGTVDIITVGDGVADVAMEINGGRVYRNSWKGGSCMFFCKLTKYPISNVKVDNSIHLSIKYKIQYYEDESTGAFGMWIKTKKELYEFIIKYPGCSIPTDENK